MNEVLDAILTWVEDIPPVLRILVTGLAVLLETSILVGLIVPGDTIVLFSSTGVTTLAQYLFTILAVVLGALAGESIGFSLGRLFGPRLRASWLGRQVGKSAGPKRTALSKDGRNRRLHLEVSPCIPLRHPPDGGNHRNALPILHGLDHACLHHLGISLRLDRLRCGGNIPGPAILFFPTLAGYSSALLLPLSSLSP